MEIFNQLVAQLQPILVSLSFLLVFLLVAVGAKVASGVYKNVLSFELKFDPKYLAMGILKGFIFALSFYGVALVSAGVPIVAMQAGILTAEMGQFFADKVPFILITVAIIKLLKDAYKNYAETLNVSADDIKEYGVNGDNKEVVEAGEEQVG